MNRKLRIMLALGVGLIVLLPWAKSAQAAPLSCAVSATTIPQGGSFTVSGTSNVSGEPLRVIMDGTTQIGSGNAAVGVPPVNYSITATVPGSTSANLLHTLRVENLAGVPFPCPDILVVAAAPPAPTAAPTAAPPDDDDDVAADDDDDGGPTQAQEQNQEQNVNFPVAFPIPHFVSGGGGGGGRSLPKTGTDIAEVGGIGTATLVAGVTLMEFARRRRRHWLAPVESHAETTVPIAPAPVAPVVAPVPPRAGETEADLLLPYTATSPPPPSVPGDFVTPTF